MQVMRCMPSIDLLSFHFFLMLGRPPTATLFPYTTLFRSSLAQTLTECKAPHPFLRSWLRRAALPSIARSGCSTPVVAAARSEEHTSELQSLRHIVCRLLLGKKTSISYCAYPRSFVYWSEV